MNKFFGKIAYGLTVEGTFDDGTPNGVWEMTTVIHSYPGEVSTNWNARSSKGSSVNDDITITNVISILADEFAFNNFSNIKYVEYMGSKWKVASVEVAHPRLILSLGGLYNGEG